MIEAASICPRCKSALTQLVKGGGWITDYAYHCPSCGHKEDFETRECPACGHEDFHSQDEVHGAGSVDSVEVYKQCRRCGYQNLYELYYTSDY